MIYERTMMACFLRQLEYNNNNHLQENQKQTIMNVHRKNAVKPHYFCFLVSITAKNPKQHHRNAHLLILRFFTEHVVS